MAAAAAATVTETRGCAGTVVHVTVAVAAAGCNFTCVRVGGFKAGVAAE